MKSKRKARGGVDPALTPIAGETSIPPEPLATASDASGVLEPTPAEIADAELPSSFDPQGSEPARAETGAPGIVDPGVAASAQVAAASADDAAAPVEIAAPRPPRKRRRGAAPSEPAAGELSGASTGLEMPAEAARDAGDAAGAGATSALLAEQSASPESEGSGVGDTGQAAAEEASAGALPEEEQDRATCGGAEFDLPVEETGLERIEDRQLLAVLFGSPEELTVPRLAEILGWKRRAVEQRLPRVKKWLDQLLLPFELRLIAGGWRLVSRSEYAELLGRLRVVRRRDRLSQAALEVLAVVAYKQPVAASEVDRIRGVNCSSILRLLLDRELVHVVGRQESPGRPLLYGTTKLFLDRFGLGALNDLPGIEIAAEGFAAAEAEDCGRVGGADDAADGGSRHGSAEPGAHEGEVGELRAEDEALRDASGESSD